MSLELQRHGCVELLLKGRVAQGAAHQRGAATYSPREWLAPRRPLQAEWISLILILLGDCAAIAKQRGAL